MADWSAALDEFLRDNELPVLAGPGGVSHEDAVDWAEAQYTAFAERRAWWRPRRRAPSATSTIPPRARSCSKANAIRPGRSRERHAPGRKEAHDLDFLLPVARFALRRGHGHDEHRVAWLVDSVEHHEREHVDHRAPVAGIVRPALEVLGPLRDALDRRVDLVKEPISEPLARTSRLPPRPQPPRPGSTRFAKPQMITRGSAAPEAALALPARGSRAPRRTGTRPTADPARP